MLETDDHGLALVPHHDGSMLGIVMQDGGRKCLLPYQSTDGVRRMVVLSGVHKLDLSSFRQGNIIGSMMVFPSSDSSHRGYNALLLRLGWGRQPVLKGRFLFEMDASYGAELIADCEDVEVVKWEKNWLPW